MPEISQKGRFPYRRKFRIWADPSRPLLVFCLAEHRQLLDREHQHIVDDYDLFRDLRVPEFIIRDSLKDVLHEVFDSVLGCDYEGSDALKDLRVRPFQLIQLDGICYILDSAESEVIGVSFVCFDDFLLFELPRISR